eukprot:CAMPEP_0198197486 /NCGR_PEP_ID=MMETSP1445-20131203/1090_1 /TAXON_ID=36898 /ORGANISM="Pyramimonas sp., Strain CCMP2087" /LENGTH=855 /DNA_ID=CAMNT_0043866785 /DNA_START=76 /DNA_END=2643 /DNA_ORIENTATION=-
MVLTNSNLTTLGNRSDAYGMGDQHYQHWEQQQQQNYTLASVDPSDTNTFPQGYNGEAYAQAHLQALVAAQNQQMQQMQMEIFRAATASATDISSQHFPQNYPGLHGLNTDLNARYSSYPGYGSMEPAKKKLKPPPAKAAKVVKPADLAEVFAGEKWLPKKNINALFTSLVVNSENFNDALKQHVPNVEAQKVLMSAGKAKTKERLLKVSTVPHIKGTVALRNMPKTAMTSFKLDLATKPYRIAIAEAELDEASKKTLTSLGRTWMVEKGWPARFPASTLVLFDKHISAITNTKKRPLETTTPSVEPPTHGASASANPQSAQASESSGSKEPTRDTKITYHIAPKQTNDVATPNKATDEDATMKMNNPVKKTPPSAKMQKLLTPDVVFWELAADQKLRLKSLLETQKFAPAVQQMGLSAEDTKALMSGGANLMTKLMFEHFELKQRSSCIVKGGLSYLTAEDRLSLLEAIQWLPLRTAIEMALLSKRKQESETETAAAASTTTVAAAAATSTAAASTDAAAAAISAAAAATTDAAASTDAAADAAASTDAAAAAAATTDAATTTTSAAAAAAATAVAATSAAVTTITDAAAAATSAAADGSGEVQHSRAYLMYNIRYHASSMLQYLTEELLASGMGAMAAEQDKFTGLGEAVAGALTSEQKKKMVRMMQTCPFKKTGHNITKTGGMSERTKWALMGLGEFDESLLVAWLENITGEKVLTPLDLVAVAIVRASAADPTGEWRRPFRMLPYDRAIQALFQKGHFAAADRALFGQVGPWRLKPMLKSHYGVTFSADAPTCYPLPAADPSPLGPLESVSQKKKRKRKSKGEKTDGVLGAGADEALDEPMTCDQTEGVVEV